MFWWLKIFLGIVIAFIWVSLLFLVSHWEKYLKGYTTLLTMLILIVPPSVGFYIDAATTGISIALFLGIILFLIIPWLTLKK